MIATVLEANASKNIFCLEITVGKEMKSTSTKKTFLRVIVFNKNINPTRLAALHLRRRAGPPSYRVISQGGICYAC